MINNFLKDVPSTRVTISRHGLMARYGCVGGLLDNEPFFCGGEYDTGNKFDDGFVVAQPNKKLQMLEKRFGAAGVGKHKFVLEINFFHFNVRT